jgi:hypothetical protein
VRGQFHPRFSLVGFGGAGLRNLPAKSYGTHISIDVAGGPDQTIWCVVSGNGWLGPEA